MTAAMLCYELDAQITEQQPSSHPDWQIPSDVAEGELWISKDLCAFHHSKAEWINGRPLYAHDFYSLDLTTLGQRWRTYRRMDQPWYGWLYHALRRAQGRIADQDLDVMRERFNQLWSIARLWWGVAAISSLHRSVPSADYLAPKSKVS
jgi:hypothetical protein